MARWRRIRFVLCSAVVAAGLTALLAAPALAVAKWSGPKNVFSTEVSEISPDSNHRSRPALEVRSDAAGNALAAWIQKVGSDCQAKWASRPPGGTWSSPHSLALATCPFTSAGFQVALALNKSGEAVVAYIDGADVVAALRPAGGSFGTPAKMNASGFASDPTVAINDNGKAAVGWIRDGIGLGNPSPFEARVRPAGGSFGNVETVTAPGSDTYFSPHIAVGPTGNVVAAWVRSHPTGPTTSDLAVMTANRPSGGPFPTSPTQTLDSFAQRVGVPADYAPDLAFDSTGRATIVWVRDTGTKLYVRSAQKLVGSDTFQPGQDVNPSDSDNSAVPRVAVDPSTNTAVAVWLQCGTSCAVRSAVRPDGGIYGSLKTLAGSLPTTPSVPALAPVIGFSSSGTAVAAWSGAVNGTGPQRVAVAQRPKGGSFGVAQIISGPAGTAQDRGPSLGFDGHGNAIAVWARFTATPSALLRYADFLASYYLPDAMIKKAGANAYIGTGVHNTSGLHQTVTAKVQPGHSATFDIKVVNGSSAVDSFKVKGPGAASGFTPRYLAGTSGTKDITTAVVQGTYTLAKLAPGGSRIFRLVVTVKSGTATGASRSWLVTATSKSDTTRTDVAVAKVVVS